MMQNMRINVRTWQLALLACYMAWVTEVIYLLFMGELSLYCTGARKHHGYRICYYSVFAVFSYSVLHILRM